MLFQDEKLETLLSKNDVHIYFIGIGGIAMSATAGLAKKAGYIVSGSESVNLYAPAKDVLDDCNIPYKVGYSLENIQQVKADVYIVSAGETEQNPEVKFLIENNIPRYSFSELLCELYKEKLRIVVAGTHGKSTTSGLLGYLLKDIDDSSFMVGGVLQNENSNFYSGEGNYAVFEGDEYKSQFDDPTPKFHYYKADILVLTNLEYDHPDLFDSFESLQAEFRELISNMPEDGLIIYNGDDAELVKLVHESNISSVSFGIENETDYKAEQIQFSENFTRIDVQNKFSKNVSAHLLGQTEEYKIQLPGKINVYNALAVIATLRALGFSQEQIALDMVAFKGIKRRFEIVGQKNGVIFIDDYAHHPTAVKQTIDAARLRYPQSRIWAIFEPHTFSRTKATLTELSEAFDGANEVLISEIYPARENIKNANISSSDVIKAIEDHNSKFNIHNSVRLVNNKPEATEILKTELKSGDVVLVMAVGNFNRLAYELGK